ncbi:hypothetical protein HID58_096378, partial [Brassica napus]
CKHCSKSHHLFSPNVSHLRVQLVGTLSDEDWCGDLDHAERFELKLVMELIRKYKVTVVPVAHPVVLAFAKSPETERYDLSSVRIIISNAVIGQCN